MNKNLAKGEHAFDEYYKTLWKERWPHLKQALLQSPQTQFRKNRFAEQNHQPSSFSKSDIPKDSNGLSLYYPMDLASQLAAENLDIQNDDCVLDLCSAPGGKALILAEQLNRTGKLHLNEISHDRLFKLKAVLKDYLPSDVLGNIILTNKDGLKLGTHLNGSFDKILLDAPCSSERHLLLDPKYLQDWSPNRTKQLAKKQYALLCRALQLLKPGGVLLYSTCSISPLENDGVIEHLFKKGRHDAEVISSQATIGKPTQFGWQIFPDQSGWGPIYWCKLKKPH